jgi:multidrug efflux pump subunit AcrA (membrane-fusion protein)
MPLIENISLNNQNDFSANGREQEAIYSTEVRDIISAQPNWIVRHGILLFLIIIVAIIAATFFIEYPDLVNANAKLVSVNPPVELKTKIGARLTKIYVAEADSVSQGTVIAEMESTAIASDVINLSRSLDAAAQFMQQQQIESAMASFASLNNNDQRELSLGEVQASYQAFMAAHQSFKQYLGNGYYLKKRTMLRSDINFLSRLHGNLIEQKGMQKEDVELSKLTLEANQTLSNDKVISAFDLRNEKSKYIGKALSLPQLSAALINNEAAMHEKQKEIMQLENEISQQKNIFSQALNSLRAELQQWKSTYLIIAPIEGKVAFTTFIQQNQVYPANQTICFINPGKTDYYAQVQIPQMSFGKISEGQEVLLKLAAYPYQEFGILKGRLQFIAAIPTDSGFIGKIELPQGLMTNQHKQLHYREGLQAQAEIITSDRRLSARLLSSFTALFERK